MFFKKDVPKNLQNSVENLYVGVSLLTTLRLQYSWLRSICPEKFFKKAVLKKPEACNLLKNRLWHKCFPVNFAKCLRTCFLQNQLQSTSRRLFLHLLPHYQCFYCQYLRYLSFVQIQKASKNLNLVSDLH